MSFSLERKGAALGLIFAEGKGLPSQRKEGPENRLLLTIETVLLS